MVAIKYTEVDLIIICIGFGIQKYYIYREAHNLHNKAKESNNTIIVIQFFAVKPANKDS